jgi:carbon monoxide dehydrogenase subunit G
MRHVEAEALVGAPRDEVWQLLDDLEGMPRWLPGVRAVSVSGPAHKGTLYQERSEVLGVARTHRWEIEEHRPPTRQVRVSRDGALEQTLVLVLDTRGSGTRLHVRVRLRSTLVPPLGALHELLATFVAGPRARRLTTAAKRAFEGLPRR